jgi:hypothetical protein
MNMTDNTTNPLPSNVTDFPVEAIHRFVSPIEKVDVRCRNKGTDNLAIYIEVEVVGGMVLQYERMLKIDSLAPFLNQAGWYKKEDCGAQT